MISKPADDSQGQDRVCDSRAKVVRGYDAKPTAHPGPSADFGALRLERAVERRYRFEERLAILCDGAEPTAQQRELAENEANQWQDCEVNK